MAALFGALAQPASVQWRVYRFVDIGRVQDVEPGYDLTGRVVRAVSSAGQSDSARVVTRRERLFRLPCSTSLIMKGALVLQSEQSVGNFLRLGLAGRYSEEPRRDEIKKASTRSKFRS